MSQESKSSSSVLYCTFVQGVLHAPPEILFLHCTVLYFFTEGMFCLARVENGPVRCSLLGEWLSALAGYCVIEISVSLHCAVLCCAHDPCLTSWVVGVLLLLPQPDEVQIYLPAGWPVHSRYNHQGDGAVKEAQF